MYGIVNRTRGIALLVQHPRVDKRRIGVVGHSLGGHNALFVAAFDDRIRISVTSCGFTAFAKYYCRSLIRLAIAPRAIFPASRLEVEHPDAEHDFPTLVRNRANAFMKKIK